MASMKLKVFKTEFLILDASFELIFTVKVINRYYKGL